MTFLRPRPAVHALRAALVTGLLTGLVAPVVLASGPAEARRDAVAVTVPEGATQVVVEGRGYGHGHGMSQYGAREAAAQGLTYREILDFYYPGTTWGTAGGRIKVLLTGDTTSNVVVSARRGLAATAIRSDRTWRLDRLRPRAARWRITAPEAGRSRLSYRLDSGPWRALRTFRGEAEFSVVGGGALRLHTPSGRAHYRGVLRSAAPDPRRRDRDTVNIVSLEAYLRGVVPQEVPASWPAHAVRAQAVAARSYAAFERAERSGYFDVYDTTLSQVYGGVAAEHPASDAAIRATDRQVRTHGGDPAFTQFSSSNGGWMLRGSRPYLQSGKDPYDPVVTWTATLPLRAFADRWPGAGRIERLVVDRHANAGGWVETVTVDGARNDYTVTGEEFRSWAGLRAAHFTFAVR